MGKVSDSKAEINSTLALVDLMEESQVVKEIIACFFSFIIFVIIIFIFCPIHKQEIIIHPATQGRAYTLAFELHEINPIFQDLEINIGLNEKKEETKYNMRVKIMYVDRESNIHTESSNPINLPSDITNEVLTPLFYKPILDCTDIEGTIFFEGISAQAKDIFIQFLYIPKKSAYMDIALRIFSITLLASMLIVYNSDFQRSNSSNTKLVYYLALVTIMYMNPFQIISYFFPNNIFYVIELVIQDFYYAFFLFFSIAIFISVTAESGQDYLFSIIVGIVIFMFYIINDIISLLQMKETVIPTKSGSILLLSLCLGYFMMWGYTLFSTVTNGTKGTFSAIEFNMLMIIITFLCIILNFQFVHQLLESSNKNFSSLINRALFLCFVVVTTKVHLPYHGIESIENQSHKDFKDNPFGVDAI